MSSGNPKRAFISSNADITEGPQGIVVRELGRSIYYNRARISPEPPNLSDSDVPRAEGGNHFVQDVIITGEVCAFLTVISASHSSIIGAFGLGTV